MHELSIATAVLETALKHADGRPVMAVGVRAGALRQVVPDSLMFYFEIVARDTACEGAKLEIEQVAPGLRCHDCKEEWSPEFPAFRCPACGSAAVTITAGEELDIQYIEVDDEEAACTGRR
jgi:hydrogenase nickel incorporation protein HypA/HybF